MATNMAPFKPRLYDEPGLGQFYDDGRMFGAVDTCGLADGKTIIIHEWSARHAGQGHSKAALQWLRAQGFKHIVANGVGLSEAGVGVAATAYWQHMHALSLVDVLLDDEGQDITPVVQPG